MEIELIYINSSTKLQIKVEDQNGNVQVMAPPSSKIRMGEYGLLCMNSEIPVQKHKKKEILEAYTLDLKQVPISKALDFLESNG